MSDTVRTLVRRRCILAAAVLTAGCQVPAARVEQNVSAMEPAAVSAAQERARTDLDCGAVKTTVLAREAPPNQTLYTLARYVYRIEAQGCGRKSVFSVACVANGPCSAMSESGIVERVK